MAPVRTMMNILMELRKVCQHPYLSAPELDNEELPEVVQHQQLIEGCGKLSFLKLLLPKLKQRGHRVLLFSQFKIALDRIEDFLYGEGYKFLRLDGDVQQAQRQKSMDAFNAPDSEFFIFLLTTRAGGVGINLATADTVIVYDPDFNPHMDLQAIARSHRYGQKNRVLVFKLMTKNSVEEQIILSGKKKMVLDHLVVQQMGKDNEEGEIDNILLHGAAALYDTNADGTSASDMRYSSKDVDDLIDKVEQDAEAEAKALEERDKTLANGGGAAEDLVKPKESMSFGFAKIWEADQNRLKEIEEAEADERSEDDDEAWLTVVQNVEKARLAAAVTENGQRLRRQAAQLKYGHDGVVSDDSPNKVKKASKKAVGKKKGKNANDSSDADFALQSDVSSSDESMENDVGINDLMDPQGVPTHRGLVAGVRPGMSKEQVRAIQLAQAARAAGATENGNGPKGVLPAHNLATTVPNPARRHSNETPEEKMLRKIQRKAEKKEKKREAQAEQIAKLNTQATTIAIPTQPPIPPTHSGSPGVQVQVPHHYQTNPAQMESAQHVLQWLYHVLSNLGMTDDLATWARMALPELPGAERRAHYFTLSRKVDDAMYKQGQRPYFTNTEQYAVVLPLLTSGAPVIPDSVVESFDYENLTLPPITEKMGQMRPGYAQSLHRYDRHLPSPYDSPQLPPMDIAPPPQYRAPISSSHVPLTHPAAPAPALKITAPAQPHPGRPSRPANQQMESLAKQPCPYCGEGHALADCSKVPSVRELVRFRNDIVQSDEPQHMKREGLAKIDHLLDLHSANTPILAPRRGSSGTPVSNGRPTGLAPGSKDAAIVVDDDEEEEQHPSKRAKLNTSSPSSTRGKGSQGCVICGAEVNHGVASCPIVLAGPESIKSVMRRFEPRNPIWTILKAMFEARPKDQDSKATHTRHCLICHERCGRNIKDCLVDRSPSEAAGRKALKAKIRDIEKLKDDPTRNGKQKEQLSLELEELYEVYLAWPK